MNIIDDIKRMKTLDKVWAVMDWIVFIIALLSLIGFLSVPYTMYFIYLYIV